MTSFEEVIMRLLSPVTRAVSGFNGGDPGKYPGAFPPPPDVVPNLENPPDAGRLAGITALGLCLSLSTVLFATRLYVKLRITRRFLLEDLTCLIAWIMLILITAASAMMIYFGLGHHSWDVSVDEYASMLKWLYITSIVYEPAAFFTKVTLLLLLARVFAVNVRLARGIYIFIITLFIAYIPIFGLKIGLCGPPSAFWDPDVPGECLNLRQILVVDVAFAIATDSLIFIIPIPSTWKMRISWKKKVKMMLLLGAGGVATAVTIYRLVKLIQYLESRDVASDFILLDALTVLELTIGLTCSCLPALNILIEHHRHPSQGANSPRTGFRRPGVEHGGDEVDQNKRIAWEWLGTAVSMTEKWPGVSSEGSRTIQRKMTKGSIHTNFDLELAMLSGRQVELGEHQKNGDETGARPPDSWFTGRRMTSACDEDSARPPDSWFTGRRMTACDGRREGWLNSCAHVAEEGPNAQTAEYEGSDQSGESKESRDISARLAEQSGNKPWESIWDGRSNMMGHSSRIQAGRGASIA